LQQGIHRQVKIGIGFSITDTIFILVPGNFLYNDFVSQVAESGVKILRALPVDFVPLGSFRVQRDIGVHPNRSAIIAAGKFPQNIILHFLTAIVIHVGDIYIDSNFNKSSLARHFLIPENGDD